VILTLQPATVFDHVHFTCPGSNSLYQMLTDHPPTATVPNMVINWHGIITEVWNTTTKRRSLIAHLKYRHWLALFFSIASSDPIPRYFFSRTPSEKKYSPGASVVPASSEPSIANNQSQAGFLALPPQLTTNHRPAVYTTTTANNQSQAGCLYYHHS